jgi:SprT protein
MQLPLEIPFSRTASVPVPAELRRACLARVAQLVALLGRQGYPMPAPSVSFDLRGRTAGQAHVDEHHVRLNAVLLIENPEAMVRETVGHEIAHLAAARRHGPAVRAHGAEWEAVMRLIGLEPQARHRFDTRRAAVVKAVHRWDCQCPQPHWLTPRRHRTALERGYRCLRCRADMSDASMRADEPLAA